MVRARRSMVSSGLHKALVNSPMMDLLLCGRTAWNADFIPSGFKSCQHDATPCIPWFGPSGPNCEVNRSRRHESSLTQAKRGPAGPRL